MNNNETPWLNKFGFGKKNNAVQATEAPSEAPAAADQDDNGKKRR